MNEYRQRGEDAEEEISIYSCEYVCVVFMQEEKTRRNGIIT